MIRKDKGIKIVQFFKLYMPFRFCRMSHCSLQCENHSGSEPVCCTLHLFWGKECRIKSSRILVSFIVCLFACFFFSFLLATQGLSWVWGSPY